VGNGGHQLLLLVGKAWQARRKWKSTLCSRKSDRNSWQLWRVLWRVAL